MPITLPEEQKFELTPSGAHVAICYRVIDLGTQLIEFKGEQKKQHKIMISWELPTELMTEGPHAGKPFSIHKRYTLSSSDRGNLRQDLEAWRGAQFSHEDFGKFDIAVLIGKPCMLNIIHSEKNGRVNANISSLMRLPKGMTAPQLVNAPVQFSLTSFDPLVYNSLSDNLKATIAKSPEYQEIMGGNRNDPNTSEGQEISHLPDDLVPF